MINENTMTSLGPFLRVRLQGAPAMMLFRVVKQRLQAQNVLLKVKGKDIADIIESDQTVVSQWKHGVRVSLSFNQLAAVCSAAQMSMNEAAAILNGAIPEGYEREASLFRARQRKTKNQPSQAASV